MEKPDIFIGVCYHKNSPTISSQYLRPLHVGATLSKEKLDFAIRDDVGDSISNRNPNWCELTGLYWIWKNVDADYYGLMHYRRLLNFKPRESHRTQSFFEVTDREIAKFGWNDASIRNACSSADILTAHSCVIHPSGASHVSMSNYEFYKREHFSKDMDIVERLVSEMSPNMRPFFINMLNSRTAFFGNITVMKRSLFREYCEWLFKILFEAEKKIDVSCYDEYQKRVWGFLAERLTMTFVDYAMAVHGATRRELPVVLRQLPPCSTNELLQIAQAKKRIAQVAQPKDDGPDDFIDIVMAVDSKYAPHAAAAIHSALVRSERPQDMRFHLLDGRALRESDSIKLEATVSQFGAELHVVDVDDKKLRWLPLNRSHISLQTYFRLLTPELLPNIAKAIYLDADIIVCADLRKLWDIPLNGNPIAGAPDEGGRSQSRRLQLPLSHRYFNAGVCVLDLHALRQFDITEEVLRAFRKYGDLITLQDQDLLNIIFSGQTTSLPLAWNANTRIFTGNSLEPDYSEEEAQESALDPKIVHFTDRIKPWNTKCPHPLQELYWLHRNETAWRETKLKTVKRQLLTLIRNRVVAKNRRLRKARTN
ncbi:DUF4422 domain-containing protein [Ruegeria sediminis]|uniref:DUF4422 domain-containing protein n=1 Tax=Ruegeria sediminis TaxID=2583820 RepID=A0ABY2X1E0_9RHOB|nr:DUF4422 domain-containing protein [Ruegeria sediminis]TMV09056.1 DUF4422 domain-containing protein [Ruegeria sediminis]